MKFPIFAPAAAVWLLFLSLGFSPVPALGPLLAIRDGIWRHDGFALKNKNVPGLQAEVLVAFDKNGVPHIFAQSDADLYLAQGFVTASQRLFQLELNARQMSGRLSEWYGDRALPFDEFFTRFNMRAATRATLESYLEDPEILDMLNKYSDGVNAWISSLKDVPFEYKVLGFKPEAFTPMSVMYMGKALSWSLAARSFDLKLTSYLQRIGAANVLDLFPEFVPEKYEDFVWPGKPREGHRPETPEIFKFVSEFKNVPRFPLANPGNGSNNWAVGPSKSITGTSLLANDTHLTLTLPSTWYEVQLSSPSLNVYGVSLAAIPGIVLGFNRNVAWATTNGTTDVMDFYEVEFENETSRRYRWNGGWLDAKVTTEKIRRKWHGEKEVDVIETKAGIILYREGKLGLAVDWTGYRTGKELRALHSQLTSQSAAECVDAFKDWLTPIQNFICADKTSIGFLHAGFVPKREVGEGRFIMDGRGPKARLTAAVDRLPQSFNPRQGYLLSANQKVVPPGYSDYLGWDYESPFRAMMIRQTLKAKDKLSAEDFMNLQNENLDLQAKMVLPLLLKHTSESADQVWLQRLRDWDYRIRSENAEAAVVRAWWRATKESLFIDELGSDSRGLLPKDQRVIWMLEKLDANPGDPDVKWVDNVETKDRVETLDEIVTGALEEALKNLENEQGRNEETWTWTNSNRSQFVHVGRFPGLGTNILPMDGSPDSVRGQNGQHGAVYKSVVQTGDWPRAWIQVPGGNEGDPLSPDYGRFVKNWARGEMREVEFFRDAGEAKAKAARLVVLSPGVDR